MYADETPILESVFIDLAPNAADITDIVSEDMPLRDIYWYFVPLTYRELAEWTVERMAV